MIKEEWKQESGCYKCPFCSKEYSYKGIATHIWRNHIENNKTWGGKVKGSTPWNKGQTKETSKSVKKGAETLSKTKQKQISEGIFKPSQMGIEAKKRLSIEQSLRNRGGKSKWFIVADQKVQGTWERDIALKFEEFNIKWHKPKLHKEVFFYTQEGKLRTYTPDFYLQELDLFLEVKGYWWGKDKEKLNLVLEQNKSLEGRFKIILKEKFERIKLVKTKEELYAVLAEMV